MKYVYFIKVESFGKYITSTSGSSFFCKDGEKAAKFGITAAKDVLYGLKCNFYDAHIEIHPDFVEKINPPVGKRPKERYAKEIFAEINSCLRYIEDQMDELPDCFVSVKEDVAVLENKYVYGGNAQ